MGGCKKKKEVKDIIPLKEFIESIMNMVFIFIFQGVWVSYEVSKLIGRVCLKYISSLFFKYVLLKIKSYFL